MRISRSHGITEDFWYHFDGHDFTGIACPVPEPDKDDKTEWADQIRRAGWNAGYETIPEFDSDSSLLSVDIFWSPVQSGRGTLVYMNHGSGSYCGVLCSSPPALMVFLKDYAAPVMAISDGTRIRQAIIRFDEVLLDGERGLPAARRAAEYREEMRRWAEQRRRDTEALRARQKAQVGAV